MLVVLGGDEARIDLQSAVLDREVVEAALERDAAHLHHPHPPALRAVVDRKLLQKHHPVGDGVKLQVVLVRGQVVEQDDGGPAPGEEVFESQDLAPVAQRTLREQPEFRQAVDDDAGRIKAFDLVEDELAGLAQLHFRRLQDGQFLARVEAGLRRNELEDGDAIQRPAVALGHEAQFALGLRQGE